MFDHNDPVLPANCFTCHNGSTATGKNPTHILTNNTCDDCHTNTLSWLPVVNVNHNAVLGSCSNCHNGQTATGKHSTHIQTTAQCDFCHITSNWSAVTFDHTTITGNCSSCHNASTATGKPVNHFITTAECDICHRNTSWTPDIFIHSSPLYPNGHRQSFQCNDCHITNSESNAWRFSAYQPDCAGCHANDYESGPHKKHENPDAQYTVSELRDCTGSCHIYTNSSLTTIKDRRNSEHRISDGDF